MPETPWAVEPFDPATAPRDVWSQFHTYRRIRAQEWDPTDPVETDEVMEKLLRHPELHWERRRYIVRDGDVVVGACAFGRPKPNSPEYESGKHLIWSSGGVITPYRRRGVGKAMMGQALDVLDEVDATILGTYAEEADGLAALEHCGYKAKAVERRSRVAYADLDWDMLNGWVADLATRAPGVVLETYPDRLPDAFLEEYCPARTVMMNLMPWDDLEHGEIVIVPDDIRNMYEELTHTQTEHHTIISREPDGTISGITDMSWQPSHPKKLQQWFTGVHPDYRGRGLGKALKAAMLLYVDGRYDGIEFVQTENSTSNGPMLAINHLVGFADYRFGTSYQIARDQLAAYLGR